MPEFPPETVECRNFPRKNRFSCRNFPRKQSTLCKSLCPPVDRRGPLRRATNPRLPAKSSASRFRLGAVGGPTRPRPLASEKFAGARSPSQRRPAVPMFSGPALRRLPGLGVCPFSRSCSVHPLDRPALPGPRPNRHGKFGSPHESPAGRHLPAQLYTEAQLHSRAQAREWRRRA